MAQKKEKTVTMVWQYAKGAPGQTRDIFAYVGVAGDDGAYRCEVPVEKVDNEALRIKRLITEDQWKVVKEIAGYMQEPKSPVDLSKI